MYHLSIITLNYLWLPITFKQMCRWIVFKKCRWVVFNCVGELSPKTVSMSCLVDELSRFRYLYMYDSILIILNCWWTFTCMHVFAPTMCMCVSRESHCWDFIIRGWILVILSSEPPEKTYGICITRLPTMAFSEESELMASDLSPHCLFRPDCPNSCGKFDNSWVSRFKSKLLSVMYDWPQELEIRSEMHVKMSQIDYPIGRLSYKARLIG